jgi:hypothetical protein
MKTKMTKTKKYVILEQDSEDTEEGNVYISRVEAKSVEDALDNYCDINCGSTVVLSEEIFDKLNESKEK